MTNNNKNLNERGDNLLNPNVGIKIEDCLACKDVVKALKSLKEVSEDFAIALLDGSLHCNNGHRIPDETIRRVLYNE